MEDPNSIKVQHFCGALIPHFNCKYDGTTNVLENKIFPTYDSTNPYPEIDTNTKKFAHR